MNVFVINSDPIISAKLLCTAHKRKMGSEACNMLMWPLKYLGLRLPDNQKGEEVSPTHENHPSSIWIRTTRPNYEWALYHAMELLEEYARLYKRRHFADVYMSFILDNYKKIKFLSNAQLTPFARCFGPFKDTLKDISDSIKAYQCFYWYDKKDFAKWERLDAIPHFWPFKTEDYLDKAFKDGIYTKR